MFDPQQMLDRFGQAIGELDLSAEQKTQIEEMLRKAADELKDMHDDFEIDGAPPGRRGGPFREYFRELHQELNEILNDEQVRTLREKIAPPPHLRDGRGGGPTTRPFGQLLRDALGKLELSEEQKTQVDQLLDDSAEKMRALREQQENVREQFREIFRDTHEQLNQILTPEQRDQLRELMPHRRGPGEGRGPRGPEDRRGGPDGPGRPDQDPDHRAPRPNGPPPPSPQERPRGEQI